MQASASITQCTESTIFPACSWLVLLMYFPHFLLCMVPTLLSFLMGLQYHRIRFARWFLHYFTFGKLWFDIFTRRLGLATTITCVRVTYA
ncbi:hypothetical protein EDD15DRAFT_2261458 [Pisolithus albus]|nr:hypothetical protein EDD15DRAFT_2261458 [Pisolithus albus]